MNEQQKKKYKEFVDMGKWNFVFTYGVFRYGMFLALFMILFDKFILDEKIYGFDGLDVALNIIVFGIAGLIWGLWSWNKINKTLKKK